MLVYQREIFMATDPICGSFDLKTRWRVEAEEDAQRFHEASRNSPSFGAISTVISWAILWDFMVIF